MSSTTIVITYPPNAFVVDGCARCEDLLNDLVAEVKQKVIVEQGSLGPCTLADWLAKSTDNGFDIILQNDDQTVVYSESNGANLIDCPMLYNVVYRDGYPNCSEGERVFTLRVFGVDLTDSEQFEQSVDLVTTVTGVPTPVLTVQQQPEPLCTLEQFEEQTGALAFPQQVQVFTFNGALITLTGSCGEFVLAASETSVRAVDCSGAEIDSRDPTEFACLDATYTFTVALLNCTDKVASATVQVRQIGSPCFDCPPDRLALESTDFAATLSDIKETDRQTVLDSATNGCGDREFAKTVSCTDRIVADRCCRGEMVLERTWTLSNDDCPGRSTSCVQHLRLIDPTVNERWQRYFPCPETDP